MSCAARALMVIVASALALGCSSTPSGGSSDSGTCSDGKCAGTDGGGGGGGPGEDGGGTPIGDGGSGPSSDAGFEVCKADPYKGKKQPLDMYIMLDRSRSMDDSLGTSGTKWAAITAALSSFLQQTGMDGISVGIQYFPLGNRDERCTVSNYSTPAIEIAPIAQSQSAIITSIESQTLGSGTPTIAALDGAIQYAKAWAASNPQDVVVVVLATDGQPNGCNNDIAAIAGVAAAGVNGTPKILTFVIGVGDELHNLNDIASGGGTSSAFLVTGGDVGDQFFKALNQIRGAATGCTYLLEAPAGQTLDPSKVNVEYKQGGTTSIGLVQVQGQSSCTAGVDAWYYDNPSSPSKILLCPATCAKVEQDANSEVNVLLGCKTNTGPT